MKDISIVELNSNNLSEYGYFCLKSQPNSRGYLGKAKWTEERISEGLKYFLLCNNKKSSRGFIEYIPSEYAWRVLHAENYIVIHCLWATVTGQGYGSYLIKKCIEDAKAQNKYGVVVITNSDENWIPTKDIFIKNNFTLLDTTAFSFELLVYKFGDYPDPYFPNDWEERARNFGDGLTILRSYQCPYIEVATNNFIDGAKKLGIDPKIIDIKTRDEMMSLAPSPYGVFNVVFNGEFLTFHRQTVRSVIKKLSMVIE